MKKWLIISACFGCLLWLGLVANTPAAKAQSAKAAWEGQWEKMAAAAKQEGKLMIYGRVDPPLRKALREAFSDKYGIELEVLFIPRGGQMAAKLKKERSAGLYIADAVVGGASTLVLLLKPEGILDSLDPALILPDVKDPKVWRKGYDFVDKAHTTKPIRARFSRFIVRNTNLVKEGEIKSYRDLLNPKWKGKMVMGDPTGPGSALGLVGLLNELWGFEETVEFLRQLVKQEPVFTKETGIPEEWVARGKYALSVGLETEIFPELVKAGMPIAMIEVAEGGQLGPGAGCLGIVNKRPHPNAAALFANWLMTKEGLTVWSKADALPVARLDVPTDWVNPMFLQGPNERAWSETEESLQLRPKLMKMCKEVLAPLMR